jgi:hypothetical protein
MPISRGQTPRQLYGLGSFVKSIGKTIKKIVKSPIGKAAGLAALTFGIPGTNFAGLMGTKTGLGLKNFLGNAFIGAADPVGTGRLGFDTSTLGKFLGTGLGKTAAIVAPSVIGGMLTKEAQEDVEELRKSGDRGLLQGYLRRYYGNLNPRASAEEIEEFVRTNSAEGGRMQYAMGSPEENAMQASGIMGLPLNENPAGVTELDLRESGGFIPPVGVKEKADDIPAMLSNNEFVFTADAVRGMGDGNVNLGAQRMYDMMKKLENGGRV